MIWQHLTLLVHSLLLEYAKRGMIRTKRQMVNVVAELDAAQCVLSGSSWPCVQMLGGTCQGSSWLSGSTELS